MRIFIVGCGPSLAHTPLDLITGQPSYACNNIHLIYDKTTWRPTRYVRSEYVIPEGADESIWSESIRVNVELGIETHLSGYFMGDWGKYDHVHELKHCHAHHIYNFDDPRAPSEWHLPYICTFGGSLIASMQMALVEGATELVLLGCDLGYHDKKPSHFIEGYEHGYEQPAFYANMNNLWGHLCGIAYHGRRYKPYKVINATVGGDLHVYPRKSLEELV